MRKPILIATIVLMALLTLFFLLLKENKVIKWIDLKYVYENFDYKKELEAKFTKTSEKRKSILDSLEIQLRLTYGTLSSKNNAAISNYENLRENYFNTKDQFEQDDLKQKMEYQEQINKQLSQYVKEFAENEKIDILLGADGNGVLMYAKESINISEEVLAYINKKYAGKKE